MEVGSEIKACPCRVGRRDLSGDRPLLRGCRLLAVPSGSRSFCMGHGWELRRRVRGIPVRPRRQPPGGQAITIEGTHRHGRPSGPRPACLGPLHLAAIDRANLRLALCPWHPCDRDVAKAAYDSGRARLEGGIQPPQGIRYSLRCRRRHALILQALIPQALQRLRCREPRRVIQPLWESEAQNLGQEGGLATMKRHRHTPEQIIRKVRSERLQAPSRARARPTTRSDKCSGRFRTTQWGNSITDGSGKVRGHSNTKAPSLRSRWGGGNTYPASDDSLRRIRLREDQRTIMSMSVGTPLTIWTSTARQNVGPGMLAAKWARSHAVLDTWLAISAEP
jgi:hypothetical protein